jgi:hypothetical protein
MSAVSKPLLPRKDQATTPEREAAAGPGAPGAPAQEPEVFWGDWLALQLWFVGVVLMWVLQVLDFVAGLSRR